MNDPIHFTRETIEISEGRKLYKYDFEIEDEAQDGQLNEQETKNENTPGASHNRMTSEG